MIQKTIKNDKHMHAVVPYTTISLINGVAGHHDDSLISDVFRD